jgi:ABC-type glycerol-3-phosphate transport system permease component
VSNVVIIGRSTQIAARVVVALAILAVIGPLLWVIRVALRPQAAFLTDPAGIGGGVTFRNLADAWSIGGLGDALRNSALVVVPGALIATALAAMAGWGIAGYRFPGRGVLTGVMVAAMFLPLAALVMPLFDQGVRLHVVGHRWWLAVVYGTVFAPWGTLFLRSVFLSVPGDIREAATIDGAGSLRVFTSIVIPISNHALATTFVINVFLQWSELILALLLLPSAGTTMVSVAIAQFSTQFRTGGPLTAAGLVIGAAPIVVLFVVAQRWLRSGAMAGALKE